MEIIINPQKTLPSIFDLPTVTQYLKLDDTTDNSIVSIIIDYVTTYAQNATNTFISNDVYSLTVTNIKNNIIELNWNPVISINSISSNSTLLTLNTHYKIINNVITFSNTVTNCVINLNAGYSSLLLLPADIKMAILMHISATYDNRNGNMQSVPSIVNNIYNKIKKIRLTFKNNNYGNC